jgi:tryptophanyl-tRNA synthetase
MTALPVLSKMSLNDTEGEVREPVREQVVNPFEVIAADERGVDYDKLVETFGTRRIDEATLQRFEKLTGRKPHRYLRRGHFFSQRYSLCYSPNESDLGTILDRYEKNKPFFLYTGRGPSSDSMHIGHVIPFTFTKSLPRVYITYSGGYKRSLMSRW